MYTCDQNLSGKELSRWDPDVIYKTWIIGYLVYSRALYRCPTLSTKQTFQNLDESGVPRFFSPAPSFSSVIVTLNILNVTGLVFSSLCSYLFLRPSNDYLIIWPGIDQHLHVEWVFIFNVENGTIYLQEQQNKTGEVKVLLWDRILDVVREIKPGVRKIWQNRTSDSKMVHWPIYWKICCKRPSRGPWKSKLIAESLGTGYPDIHSFVV